MMDPSPAGGNGHRRGKKKGRHGRRRYNAQRPRGSRQQQPHEWFVNENSRDDSSILGGRPSRVREHRHARESGPPDAFAVFCAYHLGITPDDGYHEPRLEDVARRYGMTPAEILELLKRYSLDDETVRASRFDMAAARLDIRLAPEGISRTESAKDLFEDYLSSVQAPA